MKQYNTLILNRIYVPIHQVIWKRSVSLLYQGLAKSLDKDLMPYDYDSWLSYSKTPQFDDGYYNYANSVNVKLPIPDILVLSLYDKLPRRDVKFTRESVFHRDKNKCAYCGRKFKRDDLTIDHIQPKSRGGMNDWRNTITSCKPCNGRKADRTPEQAGMKLRFQPVEPKWMDALAKSIAHPDIRPTWVPFLNSIGI